MPTSSSPSRNFARCGNSGRGSSSAAGSRRARLRRGGDRVAHDDRARPLREHPARDHRGRRGRLWRRRRDHVLPFTAALGLPDAFARRRRAQHATHSARGSPISLRSPIRPPAPDGIEDSDRRSLHAAWTLFQEIEAAGGAAAALEQRLHPEAKSPRRATAREAAVARAQGRAHRRQRFPDLGELPVAVLDVPRPAAPREGCHRV